MQESSLKIFEETYHLKLDEIQRSLGTTIFQAGDSTNYFDTDIPPGRFYFRWGRHHLRRKNC